MDFFNVLTMIGALALFLYGMKIMGDALSKLAGGKLEQILENMTNSPIKAVLLGAGVTAVIQSSSATTVMVVGFVNSGIMKLSQAVGIIMGANIGTTITSWILSLAGIESGNFFLCMMKPSSFAPVLAIIGIIYIMFQKNEKKHDIGTIFIGFAILMFGMETMSSMAKPLANVPEFTGLFTSFENPILGMIVGALLTAVIQSSSASVGILQAMCVTGSVSVGAAIPVIMGQNIGTCVTALISGIGAKRNAKRASLVHLYFNMIGTFIFMVVFYGINAFVHFPVLSESASAATIAIIHSVFNIVATIVLLPAAKIIERLAYLTVPEVEEENMDVEKKILDERFLERPAFAVSQVKSTLFEIAKMVEESMNLCVVCSDQFDEDAYERIYTIENLIDEKQDELNVYMAKLSAKPLNESDGLNIGRYKNWLTDLERISDYEKGIVIMLRQINDGKEHFSKHAKQEQKVIFSAVKEMVENSTHCMIHEDRFTTIQIDALGDLVSELKETINENHRNRLEKGKCSIKLGMALSDIVTSLERISRHCTNIAEVSVTEDDLRGLHQMVKYRREGNEDYKELLIEYKKKFSL